MDGVSLKPPLSHAQGLFFAPCADANMTTGRKTTGNFFGRRLEKFLAGLFFGGGPFLRPVVGIPESSTQFVNVTHPGCPHTWPTSMGLHNEGRCDWPFLQGSPLQDPPSHSSRSDWNEPP